MFSKKQFVLICICIALCVACTLQTMRLQSWGDGASNTLQSTYSAVIAQTESIYYSDSINTQDLQSLEFHVDLLCGQLMLLIRSDISVNHITEHDMVDIYLVFMDFSAYLSENINSCQHGIVPQNVHTEIAQVYEQLKEGNDITESVKLIAKNFPFLFPQYINANLK